MSAGLAVPAFIILGCALLAGIVALVTRKKRALWDIFPGPVPEPDPGSAVGGPVLYNVGAEYSKPEDEPDDDDADNGRPTLELVDNLSEDAPVVVDISRPGPEILGQWHQRYEQTVSAWIENHQRVLADINASGLQVDMGKRDELLAGHEELAPKMREAIASHPSPVMRAELSALHVAGEATVFAVIKSDYETARRQHLVYVQYRDEWIERLRQFSESPMSNLRALMNTDEFELEEIRAALETALIEIEESDAVGPDFEAPIVVREDPDPVPDVDEQSAETLEAAVGTPDDTTDSLEGGRIRRIRRRLSR
ncbi:hypothetical protein [Candidatus Poriferisocius sp.]|uniref:hypothetical protein n=1 Tax=Candidatus Poriferisocius sp. TaxID=3101276 RepID=UPI003B019BD7